ncbi:MULTISPECIES: DUF2790 domain-containing protein [Pseudomonas]|uniref:DUF2790 domain-containing protein n=1 Tax=Pseudomonas gregormendelii TaxID=1628277 RepID=A0ABS3ANL5_9PSED|nr:DUF2790 domain-containing protein [Pseudomonas gregormendelii]MBN3968764.1 DUF2790 domain-containing protein [Pseudomonas gregormendelii]
MKLLFTLFLTIAASGAYASADVQTSRTGVPTDVAKILSVTDIRFACGIVPVEMVYQDSQGARRVATYMEEGGGCQTN